MENDFLKNKDDTSCWVYVLADTQNGGAYNIGYTLASPDEFLRRHEGSQVVWFREFRGLAEGIAYKLLLENMEFDTLDYMIKHALPEPHDKK